jgi:hypothetical protein
MFDATLGRYRNSLRSILTRRLSLAALIFSCVICMSVYGFYVYCGFGWKRSTESELQSRAKQNKQKEMFARATSLAMAFQTGVNDLQTYTIMIDELAQGNIK